MASAWISGLFFVARSGLPEWWERRQSFGSSTMASRDSEEEHTEAIRRPFQDELGILSFALPLPELYLALTTSGGRLLRRPPASV